MSDNNNRNDGMQDYLDLLDEYAHRDTETNGVKNEEIDESFYNEDIFDYENSQKSKTRVDLSVFDEEKPKKRGLSAPPVVKSDGSVEKNPFKRFGKWFKKLPKGKKILVSIIAVILAILIVMMSCAGIFVIQKISLLGDALGGDSTEDVIYDDGEFEDIEIDIGSAGFKQSLIDWATNGNDKHMSSKNVINVLLIGADSRNGTNSGNTDVMMLLSVNKKTKQLKMVSFFRDSYLYVEGKNSSYCTKLNAAYSMGGPETLMKTIENNYKLDIDNYVMVNFESFKSVIDAMGGVTVDVQQYEADYNYKKFKVELPVGEDVTLNGEQALCFVRIRNCDADGDVSRTRRQRQVIDSILSRVKKASISDLNKYIDILLPYVDTGYSEGQILSLGIKAITGGWANYERKQLQMPPEDCRTSGSANMWIWVVDYELAAHKLQTELYGQSNINITEDRVSIIDVYNGANYTGTNSLNDNKAPDDDVVTTTTPVITTAPQTTEIVDVTDNVDDVTSESDTTEFYDDINDVETDMNTEESTDISSGDNTIETGDNSGDTPDETEAVIPSDTEVAA
ncbi:MAG: LCP family protein [Clostridia bacterium]|nr:LCP family protein [Clostridia bacterium]